MHTYIYRLGSWIVLTTFLLAACRSPEAEPKDEFGSLPKLDTLIRLNKPDLTQLAISGRGPANRPIRVSRGASPGLTGYTYDSNGKLLARFDPTVFGWNDYFLGEYQQDRLRQVYHGSTYYPVDDIDYAPFVARYSYNNQQQVDYVLHYDRITNDGQYKLSAIEQYRYTIVGQIQASRFTALSDGSYRRSVWLAGNLVNSESFSKDGVSKADYTFYGYDDQANPFVGLFFFGLDYYNVGCANNLVETRGSFGVTQRAYKLDYDASGRITTRYVRSTPNDPWTAEYRFYYNQ